TPRPARAQVPRGSGDGLGPAADDERVHADCGGDARPGLPRGRGEGRSHPRANGRSARPSGRRAAAPARPRDGRGGKGSNRVRTRGRTPLILAPEVETRPWTEQRAMDDARYRGQLPYLFDNSTFYREKLASAWFSPSKRAGGLADIAQLPLTEKREIRATCTPDNPIGAHLCVPPSEIV